MKSKFILAIFSIGALSFGSMQAEGWDCCDPCYDSCYDDCCCGGGFFDGFDFCCSRWYGKFVAGANFTPTQNIDDVRVKLNTGYYVGGAVGLQFPNCFRVEGELIYNSDKIKEVTYQDERYSIGGHSKTWSLYANFLYDFKLDCFCFVPYLGVGVGYQWADGRITVPASTEVNVKEKGFIWQVIAGVSYPLGCDWDIGVEYRYHDGKDNIDDHSLGFSLRKFF